MSEWTSCIIGAIGIFYFVGVLGLFVIKIGFAVGMRKKTETRTEERCVDNDYREALRELDREFPGCA